MLIPVRIACPTCNNIVDVKYDTSETSITISCQKCGFVDSASVDPNFHIGHALLQYSATAYQSGDNNLSILFSAMAIDCYLSWLYHKWRDIEELDSSRFYDPEEVESKIQKELERFRNFLSKAKNVEKLIYPKGIADFINSQAELESVITKDFPDIKVEEFAKCIRDQVMWRRNNIVHMGKRKYSRQDAQKCYYYSRIFIDVLEKMDVVKSRA